MGKQSARIYYQGKDHKDIYFQGNYHVAMYKGSQLVWKKIYGGKHIPYIAYEGRKRIIKIAYIEDKETFIVNNSKKFVSYEDHIIRGKNIVGFVTVTGRPIYSKDGMTFKADEEIKTIPYGLNTLNVISTDSPPYSCQVDTILWRCWGRLKNSTGSRYFLVSTNIKTSESEIVGGYSPENSSYLIPISGILNPDLNIGLYKRINKNQTDMFCYDENGDSLHMGAVSTEPGIDRTFAILGANEDYIYTYFLDFYSTGWKKIVGKSSISDGSNTNNITTSNIDYKNIQSSLYKDGKFIVYFSTNGKLEIYTTENFLSFAKKELRSSVEIYDITSKEMKIISFDSDVSGDFYIQPYCNLDNTYYFDDNGIMRENNGCLFTCTQVDDDGANRREAMFYFDNFYFEESENNFCELPIS